MYDLIERQAAIDAIRELTKWYYATFHEKRPAADAVINKLMDLPSARTEQQWIPFVLRPLTDEEKEENPGLDYFLDGKLPDNGQKILITVKLPGHEEVQTDEFYSDFGGSYLDGQYEIGTEAVAWKPLPEPYTEEDK